MALVCKYCQEPILSEKSRCPNCGYDNGANTFESVLTEMVNLFGKHEFCHRLTMPMIFSDLAPELTEEKLMVKYLFEVDGPGELFEATLLPPEDAQMRINQVVASLKKMFISEEKAREICTRFMTVVKNCTASQENIKSEATIHHNLHLALEKQGKFEEAVAEGQKAVELDSGNAIYHANLGATYKKMGRYEEALEEMETATFLTPGVAIYHAVTGRILLEQGKFDEAVDEIELAIKQENDNIKKAMFFEILAFCLAKAHRSKEAIEKIKSAIALDPNNGRYYFDLCALLYSVGEYKESEKAARSAIVLEPDNANYKKRLDDILKKLEK